MNVLVDKTTNLKEESISFKRSAKDVKNRDWWRNLQGQFYFFIAIVIIMYIVLAMSCGITLEKCI